MHKYCEFDNIFKEKTSLGKVHVCEKDFLKYDSKRTMSFYVSKKKA